MINKMLADQVKIEDSIKTKDIDKTGDGNIVEVNEKIRKIKRIIKVLDINRNYCS